MTKKISTAGDVWTKAAVIGTVWASFEIIFGGFLHALRIPFAGTSLTFFSLVLLTAFAQKYRDKNLFIKAGIIAALLRSLMPTSVIFGPLIGILVEATLFQLFYNLTKGKFYGFALAAVLAMFSAIIHKLVGLILIYGWDIVKILERLYFMLMHITHLHWPLQKLLVMVLVVYTFLGILAAYIGIKTGKKAVASVGNIIDFTPANNSDIFKINPGFKYHKYLIFIHLLVLILLLAVSEYLPVRYGIMLMGIYFLFLYVRYGKSIRRLNKPVFWFQLGIVLLVAVLLWPDKKEGLAVGLKMIVRALTMVSVFTVIGIELRNPVIKNLLYRKGFEPAYRALQSASATLPYLIEQMSRDRHARFNPFKLLEKALEQTDALIDLFGKDKENQPVIFVISGKSRSGKTTKLTEIIQYLKTGKPGLFVDGIIAHGIDDNGDRKGFEIELISRGIKIPLTTEKTEADMQYGRFGFKAETFREATEVIIKNADRTDVLVLDEIGPLELRRQGWFPLLQPEVGKKIPVQIWTVRKKILEQVLSLCPGCRFYIYDANKISPEELAREILKYL